MSARGKPTPGWRWAEKQRDNPDVLILDLPNDGGPMHFRRIPAGSFPMGSRDGATFEQPVHLVTIPEDFYMGIFPVTQRQFRAWRAEHENGFRSAGEFDPDLLPAESMNWEEGVQFCAWLEAFAGIPKGYVPYLPLEPYWEYACRAHHHPDCVATEYANGDGIGALEEIGWYAKNCGERAHAVGELQRNAWDLFDMHGNVWEWCHDAWSPGAYRCRLNGDKVSDPGNPCGCSDRVVRGGSWFYKPWFCRSAFRIGVLPGERLGDRGFRVSLLPGPVAHQDERGAPRTPFDDLTLPRPPADFTP